MDEILEKNYQASSIFLFDARRSILRRNDHEREYSMLDEKRL